MTFANLFTGLVARINFIIFASKEYASVTIIAMKAKYFIVYIGVGAAFLAVSLWIMLSRGNNPKAINAKYKLGGIMLIAWSIIATASCEKGPLSNVEGSVDGGEVMCYDPVPSNYVTFSTDKYDKEGRYYLTPGGNLTIIIEGATYKEYSFAINKRVADKSGEEAVGELLQTNSFTLEGDSYSHQYKIEYSPADKDYTGQVILRVWGPAEENQAGELLFWQWNLFITNGDED